MHDPRTGDAGPGGIVEGTSKVVDAINHHWKKTFERRFTPHSEGMRKLQRDFQKVFTNRARGTSKRR